MKTAAPWLSLGEKSKKLHHLPRGGLLLEPKYSCGPTPELADERIEIDPTVDTTRWKVSDERFAHDFSQVRVHASEAEQQSARQATANTHTGASNVASGDTRLHARVDARAAVLSLQTVLSHRDSPDNTADARLVSAGRIAAMESVSPISKTAQERIEVERAGGRPLETETRSEMERILGVPLSGVRIHSGPSVDHLARHLNATAFTQGRDVFLGEGCGRETLAHELTHAGEGRAGPGTIQRQRADERVLNRSEAAERSRTVAKIEIVGHASPRWRGAPTSQIADEKNWRLAEQRAQMTRKEIEALLTDLLPNTELVYDYRFKRATEMEERDHSVADVTLEVEGRGSRETLAEAGPRGRGANDDPMRRVDVKVILDSKIETDVEEEIERTERKSGATKDWSIWVAGEAGAEAVGKAGAVLIQLRNNRTNVVGTYAGWMSGVGVSVGVSIAKTSVPDFESFVTPAPMTFADFSGANFSISSFGIGLGAFGAEWSKFRFERFLGGLAVPGAIQVGGISFGGIEINLGSIVYGGMFLTGQPSEVYFQKTKRKRVQSFESLSQEISTHRVLFVTGSSDVDAWQSDLLNEYLQKIVVRSGL